MNRTRVRDLTPIATLLKTHVDFSLSVYRCRSLETPPDNIAYQGKNAILRYFEELQKGAITINEVKVLIVGQGQSGKTTLRKKLIKTDAELPPKDETTWGIEIETLGCENNQPRHDEQQGFQLHLWDFGGQNIQHYAHQFFLTGSALYVLLTNEREQNPNFQYWLNIIQMLSEDSPVIILQNEMEGHFEPIQNRAGILESFANVVSPFYRVDLSKAHTTDAKKFDELREAIIHHAKRLPHVGREYPKSFVEVRREIEALTWEHQYIEWDEFEKICFDKGIDNSETVKDYAKIFHILGNCLYFPNDIELENYVFLRPKWVIDALYDLLRHELIARQKGLFSEVDSKIIWSDRKYRKMHSKLIRLMVNFELCFPVKDKDRYFIVPQRLDSVGDEYEWNEEGILPIYYDYKFMPKGLLTRLICRLHKNIEAENVWNEAVIFSSTQARAFVREVYAANKIEIQVVGEHRSELLNRIVEELDDIHVKAKYSNLQVRKKVPCPCDECQKNKTPTFYDYDQMKKYLLGGKVQFVPCPILNDVIEIREILGHSGIKSDFEKITEKIKSLIASDKIQQAVDLLMRHFPEEHNSYLLSASRSRLVNDKISGALDKETIEVSNNQLRQNILSFLEETDGLGFRP